MTSGIQHLLREAAVEGDAIPLDIDDIVRAGRRRRRGAAALMACTIAGTVAVVVVGAAVLPGHSRSAGQVGGSAPSPSGRGPDVTIASDGAITAIFHDPGATATELNALFHERGLHITVVLQASSPSLVGRMFGWGGSGGGGPAIAPINSNQSCGFDSPCTIGVTVPAGFTGTATLDLGRQAAPNEIYEASTDGTTPGEALACTNILGATVEVAEKIVASHGLTAIWRGLPDRDVDPSTLRGQVVSGVTPVSLGHYMVKSEPKAEFDAYPSHNQPCVPTRRARAG
jgi:hypothetical protein